MSADVPALERILRLSAFDGDSSAALRTLHAHFAARFPDCSLALVLVGGQGRGQARLAGLIGPEMFTMLLVMAILTTAMTAPLLSLFSASARLP